MPAGYNPLTNSRINGVFQGLTDPRTLPGQLLFSTRVGETPAEDGEIMARFIGYIQIADLVADDSRAAVYAAGKFQFETANIPNIKIGANLTQSMIKQLQAIQANSAISNVQVDAFESAQARLLSNVLLGIRQRKEVLLAAMLMDGLTYDRLGIKLTSVTWGMPSDLKITPSTPWTTSASATPVDDILNAVLVAKVRYGITYDRITMTTPAFRTMIACTEFQNKAKVLPLITFLGSYTPLPLSNIQQQLAIAQSVIGMNIELYDARYWSSDSRGQYQLYPILDLNAVILSASALDGDRNAADFANGIVTESVVSSWGGDPVGGGPSYGPIAYATFPENLNPPNITFWGVQRGFPRKHLLHYNACLRIGTITDTISTAAPF
ncbi:MAG TPA: major capsid protein [Candidatus Paceibacterota bacterium]